MTGNGVLTFENEFEVVTAHKQIIRTNDNKVCVITWWCEITESQFQQFSEKYRDILPDTGPPEAGDATTH